MRDLVVVGSGAGGLTAAIVAAQSGLDVVLLEKAETIGGTTALSGGGLWIPANSIQKRLGIEDSEDAAIDYLRELLGNWFDANKIETFVANGHKMVDYMREHTHVKLFGFGSVDYEAELTGAGRGRTLQTANFDSRLLGKSYEARIRAPLRQMSLFGSMQLTAQDAAHFSALHKSIASFWYSGKRFLRFLYQRAYFGRGVETCNGNALVCRLLLSAIEAGVELRTGCHVDSLIRENGRVVGVNIRGAGQVEQIQARKGVILATGGRMVKIPKTWHPDQLI